MILDVYELAWRPVRAVLRTSEAGATHDVGLALLRRADGLTPLTIALKAARRLTLPARPTTVGGVTLPHPIVVSAGLVKGDGFADEWSATLAARSGRDIIPGWRSVPALVGPVEFGSFTRRPRIGNRGQVVWRDDDISAMQNRVGLRNPGASAAATFLRSKGMALPRRWGVNLAPSPGLDELVALTEDLDASATAFRDAFDRHPRPPAWYTLNLSCPNTEDDPGARQTEAIARALAERLVGRVAPTPVWVKVGPRLAAEQYRVLARTLADVGVRAIVATNTLARPAPNGAGEAGVSGRPLRYHALEAVQHLAAAIARDALPLDIIASGGVLSGRDLAAFTDAGAGAAMVYSALVFRGPLAPALILREWDRRGERSRQRRRPTPIAAGHG